MECTLCDPFTPVIDVFIAPRKKDSDFTSSFGSITSFKRQDISVELQEAVVNNKIS
jgi:hypothetical protein